MPDTYSVLSQADILAAVQGADYISTVDCASFFYQWRVKPQDRHKLTVSSHRGQETFKVAVMGYKNSPAYIQRMIDQILHLHRSFSRVYVSDIVVYTKLKSLEEHLIHLNKVFISLMKRGICLSAQKSFLDYPTIQLLGQHVDTLGLATAEDKLAAIVNIEFPQTLSALEKYLGMTGYLQQYIPYYAAVIRPLQERKTRLNHGLQKHWAERKSLTVSNVEGNACKSLAGRTPIEEPTPSELDSFHQLRGLFSRPTILIHYDLKRQLYADMNTSKEFGFGAHVYHMKESHSSTSGQKGMKSILFLSKALADTETHYWPMELKVAGLVWLVQKIRHMLKSAKKPTIVYTDHSATLGIVRQSSLTLMTLIDKMNLQLVHVSEYLQRFHLDVQHKAGKVNIVPDALSQLASSSTSDLHDQSLDGLTVDTLTVDALIVEIRSRLSDRAAQLKPKEDIPENSLMTEYAPVYAASLVKMNKAFQTRILEAYDAEPRWDRIQKMISDNNALGENTAKLPYRLV